MKTLKTIVLCLAVCLLCFACKDNKQVEENNNLKEVKKDLVKEINSDEFLSKVLDISPIKEGKPLKFKGDKPVIIDFYATWCGPCKRQAPIMEEIAKKYKGKIDVYKIDVDKTQDIARFFNINSIPTLLFIPKGGELFLNAGLTPQEDIEESIETMLLNQNE
ncbi:MAG: thioredoxin [Bacteroidales bacterium]|nr:thioredoxin [Bacteroidales bacterium]